MTKSNKKAHNQDGEQTGIFYSMLARPWLYNTWQKMVGVKRVLQIMVDEYIQPVSGMRILDIGCGTCNILAHINQEIEYFGYDPNFEYIELAQSIYTNRGTFVVGNVTSEIDIQPCDVVLAFGVLHHLSDNLARDLLKAAKDNLKSNGRLITHDPCIIPGGGIFRNFMARRDRGQYVRQPEELKALADEFFETTQINIRQHFYRLPYSIIVMVMQ